MRFIVSALLLFYFAAIASAQEPWNGSYISLGTSTTGIGLGNSKTYNGIRFNAFGDSLVQSNGLNVTVINGFDRMHDESGTMNGISTAVIGSHYTNVNGVAIGTLGSMAQHSNGILAGGFAGGSEDHNGILFSLALAFVRHLNGIELSAFGSGYDTLNGLAASLVGHGPLESGVPNPGFARGAVISGLWSVLNRVDGFTCSLLATGTEELHGLAVSGVVTHWKVRGVVIGLYTVATSNTFSTPKPKWMLTDTANPPPPASIELEPSTSVGLFIGGANRGAKVTGLQIGLFNEADELHGVQIGLLNHAKNSSLPWLPFINLVL